MINKLNKEIDLKLTLAESIVLSDFIRKIDQFEGQFSKEEKRALWNLECALERILTEPLVDSYSEVLEQSKQLLRRS